MRFWVVIVVTLVRTVLGPTDAAAAQESRAADLTRVEVGGSAGVVMILPTFGVSAALPVGFRTAVEGVAEVWPITSGGMCRF